MRLSGKVIVAAFCFFIVLTPAVLISLLASATNGAVSSIVPFWNGAIAKVVGGDAAKILKDVVFCSRGECNAVRIDHDVR